MDGLLPRHHTGLVSFGIVYNGHSCFQAHVQPQAAPTGLQRAPATEQQLWAYLTQLAAALRAVHAAGLAVGAALLTPSKVLLASRATSRIRIGAPCLGA